jgi:hypothetical protein
MDRMIDTCVELALIYHTSPFEFLGRPSQTVAQVYVRTQAVLASLKADDNG